MPLELVLELYDLWAASNYVALPYPGSLLQQPYWVRHDFAMLSNHEAWHREKTKARKGS
jgi:hypothetical protein